jgi:localization factor PodJL
MTSANPWSVKGVEPRTREAAKDLARREGLTLGEWLNRLVSDLEDETNMAPPPQHYRDPAPRERSAYSQSEPSRGGYQLPPRHQREPDYARFSRESEVLAVTSALDQLAHRLQQSESRAALSISSIDDTVQSLGKRIELTDRAGQAAIGRLDATLHDLLATQTALNERLRRMDDGEAQSKSVSALRALENALTRLATQVYANEDRTDAALSQFDARLLAAQTRNDATLEQISQKVEATLGANATAVNAETAMRLERMEATFNGALTGVDDNFKSVAARLARMELSNPEGAIADMRRALDERMDTFSASLDGLLARTRNEIAREIEGQTDSKVQAIAEDLRARLDASEARNAEALERVGSEVARAAEALDQRLRMVEHTDTDATLTVVRREITDISRTLDARLTLIERRESEAMEEVGAQVARISQKIDQRVAQSEERSAKAIEQVGDQIVKLAETIQGRQEQAVATLTERLREADERASQRLEEELARSEQRTRDFAQPLEKSLDRLSDRLGRLETAGPTPIAETVPMGHIRDPREENARFDGASALPAFAIPDFDPPPPVKEMADEHFELPDWSQPQADDVVPEALLPKAKTSGQDAIFDDPFATPADGDDTNDFVDEMFVVDTPNAGANPFAEALPTFGDSVPDATDPFTGGFGEDGPTARKGNLPDYLENARRAAEAAVALDAVKNEQKKSKKKPVKEASGTRSPMVTMAVAGITGVAVLVGGYVMTRPKPEQPLAPAAPSAAAIPVQPLPPVEVAPMDSGLAASEGAPSVVGEASAIAPASSGAALASSVATKSAAPIAKQPVASAAQPAVKTAKGPSTTDASKPSAANPLTPVVKPPSVASAVAPRSQTAQAASGAAARPVAASSAARPSAPTVQATSRAAPTTPAPTMTRTPAPVASAPSSTLASAAAPRPVPPASSTTPQSRLVPAPQAKAQPPTTPQIQLALADQRLTAGDKVGAAAALLRAAELGAVSAQVRIARMFEKGEGVPIDLGKARQWTQRAAEAGDRQAMHNLAVFFANGDGVAQDYTQAAKWFRDAAQRGVADSQFNLGALSEQGLGVRKDLAEAYYWYTLAAKQGDKDAAQRAAQLEGSLTPSARTAAKARADAAKTAP